jgi:hypothetical protein
MSQREASVCSKHQRQISGELQCHVQLYNNTMNLVQVGTKDQICSGRLVSVSNVTYSNFQVSGQAHQLSVSNDSVPA